jgi:hypothetical protein
MTASDSQPQQFFSSSWQLVAFDIATHSSLLFVTFTAPYGLNVRTHFKNTSLLQASNV